jgi:hypothetical protein
MPCDRNIDTVGDLFIRKSTDPGGDALHSIHKAGEFEGTPLGKYALEKIVPEDSREGEPLGTPHRGPV